MSTEEIRTRVGRKFAISLEAIPTTGYTWEAEFDREILELKEKRLEQHPSAAIGGGGKEEFKFTSMKTGQTYVTMRHRRSWEKTALEEKRFRIIVTE
nr:protease inhibitor I42 family protein [Candidatus Njordarchaeum guaymaensis]